MKNVKHASTGINTPDMLVSDQQLADLLCSAIEGGSNYWIGTLKNQYGKGFSRIDISTRYLELPFHEGSGIWIMDSDDEGEPTLKEPVLITNALLRKGLNIVFEKYLWHFINVVKDNSDAETGDVVLQCAVFGDIIYG